MRVNVEEIELDAGGFHLGPLSLSAGDGEYVIILGPTGAGKTLTLETIAGLRRPQSGRIVLNGCDVTAAAPESRRIGFLYQDSLLFPHMRVRDNLAYGTHRLPRGQRALMVERIARLLELGPLLDRMPRGLSGGERQRAALGRALATNPALLLLDEPMAALDPNSRAALRRTLRELHRELATTAIHVTHSFSEALALGDRVAILIDGRIRQLGRPADVFAHPDSPQIARFLRTASLDGEHAGAEPSDGAITISAFGLSVRAEPDAADAPILIAEHAEISAPSEHCEAARDLLAARLLEVRRDGDKLHLRLNLGVELRTSIGAGTGAAEALAEGAPVWVRLPRAPQR
jgi:molybdate transport system ATP-binding protein